MAGTDFSHLTTDELIKGIKALDLPDYIRSKAYGIDVRETLAQMTEMTIQLGVNMGLSPDDALSWARKLQESVSQSEFDSWVATLLDGGPSIFMNTLSELQTTYPNGAAGVALVRETDPAKIYVWNGSAWEDFGDYQGVEVKDGTVTSSKIADEAVTAEKLSDEYNARLPWITEGSLNNVFKSGVYLVSGAVEQNPLAYTSFLSVEATSTTNLNGLIWVKQTITNAGDNGEQYYRIFQRDKTDGSIKFIRNWIKCADLTSHEQELDKLENVEILPLVEDTKVANGLYSSSGSFVANDGYDSYRFDVDYQTDYRHNRGNPLTIVAFDQYDKFVKSYSTSGHFKIDDRSIDHVFIPVKRGEPFVVSKGVKKVEYTTENGFYANGKQIGEWSGKKWVALGTSMTMVDNSYFKYVENRLGLIGENLGHSGGGITTSASAGNTTMQEIENLEDFNGLLTIEVGPNDGGHPLGELGDTTTDTFYGCLYQAFSKAQQNTTARIVVLTMASQWADTGTQNRRDVATQWTQFAVTRQHTRKAIMDVATWFSLPVIDVQGESGVGGWVQNSQTSYDHIHPTKLGGDMIGMYVAKQIDSRIQPFPDELMLASDRPI